MKVLDALQLLVTVMVALISGGLVYATNRQRAAALNAGDRGGAADKLSSAAVRLAEHWESRFADLEAQVSRLEDDNRDLAASNSRLQQSVAMLKAANEELHRANEELQTSIAGLRQANEQLRQANADLQRAVAILRQQVADAATVNE